MSGTVGCQQTFVNRVEGVASARGVGPTEHVLAVAEHVVQAVEELAVRFGAQVDVGSTDRT
jgi:hypothetical protein